MTTITIPHQFKPRKYQLSLLRAMDAGVKRAIIIWHRRSGKDKTCFNFMIKQAFKRVGTYYYFLPEYSQARKIIWDNIDNDGMKMLDHIPEQVIQSMNSTLLKIELVNGSVVQLIGADTFKQGGVGANPIGVVFSEYSITNKEAWNYVRPILAANGGWAIFNGTPRGKNHAWELLQMAKNNPEEWFSEVLTANDTQVLSKEILEAERKEMPQALFNQEYMCEFLEGAGQFFRRIHQNAYDKDRQLPEDGDFQLGVDLAKYQDWSVITPFNLNHFIVYPQERFNQVDWNLQKARIEATARRYGNALIWPDSTGVGDPIVEDLKARGLNIGGENGEGFKFTEVSRQNLLNNLALLLEQDKIKIPNDEGLIGELEAFQYKLGENGKVKVVVPDGTHDDRVFSLALSVWGIREPVRPDMQMVGHVYQNRNRGQMFK